MLLIRMECPDCQIEHSNHPSDFTSKLRPELYQDLFNSLPTPGRDPVVVVSQPGGVEKPLNVLPVLSPGSSHSQSPLRQDDRRSEFWAEVGPERIVATESLPCYNHHLSPGEASGRLHPGYQSVLY